MDFVKGKQLSSCLLRLQTEAFWGTPQLIGHTPASARFAWCAKSVLGWCASLQCLLMSDARQPEEVLHLPHPRVRILENVSPLLARHASPSGRGFN